MNPDLNLHGTLARLRIKRGNGNASPQVRVALVVGASVGLAPVAAL